MPLWRVRTFEETMKPLQGTLSHSNVNYPPVDGDAKAGFDAHLRIHLLYCLQLQHLNARDQG